MSTIMCPDLLFAIRVTMNDNISVIVGIAYGISGDLTRDLLYIMYQWTKRGISYEIVSPSGIDGWPVFRLTGPVDTLKNWYYTEYDPGGESFENFLEYSLEPINFIA